MGLRKRRRRRRQSSVFTYSAWDGTQTGFELDADDVFGAMSDDLLYHGDINAAIRRLLQEGFEDAEGNEVEGLRDLLERVRQARQDRQERFDLGGVYDDIAAELDEVVSRERTAIDETRQLSESLDDERQRELTSSAMTEREMELDLMPPDLAGRVQRLQDYEFTSAEARDQFEGLLDRLREQLMQQMVDQMSGAVENMSAEDMSRMKDMMSALNEMLEQRARGEEPDFEGFMEEYGDFFPENPQNLDELLEVMARRMAAMQQMLNSMTPEQRAQLQQLSDQLLEDMDLRWQAEQLGEHLREQFPQMGWDSSFEMSGGDPLDMAQAMDVMSELGELDQMEQMLRSTPSPGALAEVDAERLGELVGPEAADSLERLGEITKMLEDAGYVNNTEGRLELTAKAMRRIGQDALSDVFRKLSQDRLGKHQIDRAGIGHERAYETKAYEYGDPFNLNIERTVRNAVRRGGGTPVRLSPDDFEVERTERAVRSSTVLMLDLSLSMPMRGNFLPAKKVAMALQSLISTQFPRDYLGLVTFAAVAHEVEAFELPSVSWDYDYGTNMQHGLKLARSMLSRQTGTKQIIMITDGEPTAHLTESGRPFFSYPPTRETVDLTMAEVMRCTREDIRINTFMLDATSYLTSFIEEISKLNGGRAFFTTNENIGEYVLVDFVEHRRTLSRGR